jgi:winged helix DNA-binding protein
MHDLLDDRRQGTGNPFCEVVKHGPTITVAAVPAPLKLTRTQILAFRRRANGLDARVPYSSAALERAAHAGLQDSMPRAALLSLHARVDGVESDVLEDPALIQLWGPRYNTYAVAKRDFALFSLGRYPDDAKGRARADLMAKLLREHLGGAAFDFHPNRFKYAATTGTVAIRWEGARAPKIWMVPAPKIDPADATRELARRYLHIFGPTSATSFDRWAGISRRAGATAFASLADELIPVRTPLGDEWLLTSDEQAIRDTFPSATTRLLPSGDAYFLLDRTERTILLPRAEHRAQLWTARVWPGALLVDGEVRGVWRRGQHKVDVDTFGKLSRAQRDAVEAEAANLPLPALEREIVVQWNTQLS